MAPFSPNPFRSKRKLLRTPAGTAPMTRRSRGASRHRRLAHALLEPARLQAVGLTRQPFRLSGVLCRGRPLAQAEDVQLQVDALDGMRGRCGVVGARADVGVRAVGAVGAVGAV